MSIDGIDREIDLYIDEFYHKIQNNLECLYDHQEIMECLRDWMGSEFAHNYEAYLGIESSS